MKRKSKKIVKEIEKFSKYNDVLSKYFYTNKEKQQATKRLENTMTSQFDLLRGGGVSY